MAWLGHGFADGLHDQSTNKLIKIHQKSVQHLATCILNGLNLYAKAVNKILLNFVRVGAQSLRKDENKDQKNPKGIKVWNHF